MRGLKRFDLSDVATVEVERQKGTNPREGIETDAWEVGRQAETHCASQKGTNPREGIETSPATRSPRM